MHKLILKKSTCYKEAIKLLNLNGTGFLPVISEDKKFLGIITDGDVRKSILNDNLNINEIINFSPYKISVKSTYYQRLNFLKKIKRRHLPLVNDDGTFSDIFTLDSINYNSYPNWVVIMAGGLGNRLGELTKDIPKPMLPLDEKPILEHIINSFIHHGFRNFVICLNYKGDLIKNYFDNGEKWSINIQYVEEKKRLGTGGALSLINIKSEAPIIVTNGDVLTSQSFESLLQFHNKHQSVATMCVREVNNKIPYGLIDIDENNNILDLKEKPEQTFHINAGIYVLDKKVLKSIPKKTYFDLTTLFKNLIKTNEIIKSYNLSDFWIDIGNPHNYKTIVNKFK